jgi:hypothetical protein
MKKASTQKATPRTQTAIGRPAIKIEAKDLLIACPGKSAGRHLVKAEEVYALLRTSTLASRDRKPSQRKRG